MNYKRRRGGIIYLKFDIKCRPLTNAMSKVSSLPWHNFYTSKNKPTANAIFKYIR